MAKPSDLLIHSAGQLLTLTGGPQRGPQLGNLGLIPDGAVAIAGGQIQAVGPTSELRSRFQPAQELDAGGRVVMPGLVDPHTHLIWIGDRADEFEKRLQGKSYLQILAEGGGILSTVRQVRAASVEQLVLETRPRLNRMLALGTTTAEAKTGYGLETASEQRMLQALLQLDDQGPLDIAPTFLGAHAIPPEFTNYPQAFTDYICDSMLPDIREWWDVNAGGRTLPFADVFCDQGAFDLEQSRRILQRAASLGFPVKIHADEFKPLGGTALAVSLGAVSADHLVVTPLKDLEALGRSETVAVALPCTPFGLADAHYTPAKRILEAGGILALATDLNPGTAWCESMQFAIALACRAMALTPAQAIAAATVNAAAAIRRDPTIGSLEVGKQADMLILQTSDYRHLAYRFGDNLVSAVIKRGKLVVQRED